MFTIKNGPTILPLTTVTFFGQCLHSERWVLRTASEVGHCTMTLTMDGGVIQPGRVPLSRTIIFRKRPAEQRYRLEDATPLKTLQCEFISFVRSVSYGTYSINVADGLPISATGLEIREIPAPACA